MINLYREEIVKANSNRKALDLLHLTRYSNMHWKNNRTRE